ncbi:MAG: hypothetical protein PXY39_02095 [archaeon]|nr:hypothetical protein [archaeon]
MPIAELKLSECKEFPALKELMKISIKEGNRVRTRKFRLEQEYQLWISTRKLKDEKKKTRNKKRSFERMFLGSDLL